MSICDSEENRKKLAWLVPGYILLAWFFCVLFQPMGLHSPTSRYSKARFLRHEKEHYEVIYLTEDNVNHSYSNVCSVNGSTVTLTTADTHSGAVIRLSESNYLYKPFNCSLQIQVGAGLDGLTAVIEDMDLREQVDEDAGRWGSSRCIDYIEAYTDKSKVRNKLCGKWSVYGSDELDSHGPKQTLVGYCYDDRSGHSCEAKTMFINVVIDSINTSSGLSLRNKKGFSIVVTGYRHLSSFDRGCYENEYECPIKDFSLHDGKSHCIDRQFKCDSHINCGFTYNIDEKDCHLHGMAPWSISTMTLLIVIYLAIVLILVLVTMLLLKWHRALRTPLDLLSEGQVVMGRGSHSTDVMSANMVTTDLPDGTTMTQARTGTVSIFVSYRPHAAPKNREFPPSYASLYLEEPPQYNDISNCSENDQSGSANADVNHLAQPENLPAIDGAVSLEIAQDHNDQNNQSAEAPDRTSS